MSFPATRLSVVERTRSHDEEIRRLPWATIVEAYWKPAYKHLLRRGGDVTLVPLTSRPAALKSLFRRQE